MQERVHKLLSWASNLALYPFGKPKKTKDGELHYISGTRRCVGALLDLLLIAVLLQVIHGGFLYVLPKNEEVFKAVEKYKMGGTLKKEEVILRNQYLFKAITIQAIEMIVVYFYYVYMWVKYAATIGMFLMGLKVIDEVSLEHMSFWQATKRFLFTSLSGIPLGIGLVWSNFDKRKRAWHDMLAKTVMVTNKSLKRHKELSGSGS
ncbi:RDD family protein [Candidatus Anaplasma sp. TIGMIC]|uniref:RDD family protein n=1 Tax=Candidatus Anaplasma sp. TIGMIC TaxID=3020713 RepID=UPI00232F2AB0|nr:RDD family protein [Candidatus Anaplasma sp. TIGMIC]MDB1135705.1 RDD family protein [Candidatus Anaplasma sp. TIGMIC]